MSQYRWKSPDDRYEFLAGYDRPLDYLFLVVDDLTVPEDKDERTVWSNLSRRDNPGGPGVNLRRIETVVRAFGGYVPDGVRDGLVADVIYKGDRPAQD